MAPPSTRSAAVTPIFRTPTFGACQLLGLRGGFSAKRRKIFGELRKLLDEVYISMVSVRDQANADADIVFPGAPLRRTWRRACRSGSNGTGSKEDLHGAAARRSPDAVRVSIANEAEPRTASGLHSARIAAAHRPQRDQPLPRSAPRMLEKSRPPEPPALCSW